MSFYPQPNEWSCGPFALKYALVMHGKFVNEAEISGISGATWWNGTNEIALSKAAKHYKCKLKSLRRLDEERARIKLNSYLRKGIPCILCVDRWSHWITVINYDKKKYIIVDSEQSPVIQIYSWQQLKKRWVYKEENEKTIFDFYPVTSKGPKYKKTNFGLKLAKELRKEKNYDLAGKWDIYFSDLIAISNQKSGRTNKYISMAEFLRRYSKTIIESVSYWHGFPSKNELKDLLRRFEFVANTYNLVINEKHLVEAISSFSSILMMYSCGKYGMGKIYL